MYNILHKDDNDRWGNTFSDSFYTTNGVRQGGIISLVYFNLYMDGLSDILNKCNVGCCINGKDDNHLMQMTAVLYLHPSLAYRS